MTNECSITDLQLAISGNLSPDREQWLCRHLEQCEACSAAIEEIAGVTPFCEKAAALLAVDELDQAVPRYPRAGGDDWSDVDFTVEYLEPCDEPNVLGRLGGYDVLEIIGRGGMGVVLKGFDRELNRNIAIKVLAPHLALSSLAKKRFAREAQAAAAVVHPHVMAIYQVQPNGRLPFLVMPLVTGESLAQRLIAQGHLELKETLRIGMQAAAGLAAAHEQGLVHRDVKPANILLEKGIERTVLTDFGLARAADDVSMTRWGIIAGTPQYMSPEQARGEPLDGRSDLFSLGCVIYEMATGVSPFRSDSVLATMRRLVDDPPQAMASLNPELPPWFIAIVERLLEKEPSRRFASATEVSELLEGCLAHVQQPSSVPLPNVLSTLSRDGDASRRSATSTFLHWLPVIRFKGVLAMIAALGMGLLGMFLLSAEPLDIAGQWTGEDWGQVVLKKTSPTEYTGTYTDTSGKHPGEIQLKWSRVQRRFNGTWGEGDDRFGELSVRRVGDEIHGAATVDPKSRINPNTLRLTDLTWTRARATGADDHGGSSQAPPDPVIHIPAATPALLAERPQLRFLAWQDEYITSGPRAAFHADGSAATDPSEFRLLLGLRPTICDAGGTAEGKHNPRFLHLWFSHPLVDQLSLVEVTLLDGTGKPVPLGGGGLTGTNAWVSEDGLPDHLGWFGCTLSPGNVLRPVTVRLRYTLGPWEHEVRYTPDGLRGIIALGNGSQFSGVGQDLEGKTFFAITVDMKRDAVRQFGVVAVTKDGRELQRSSITSGGETGGALRVQRFTFAAPLADIAHFRLGTRPVRTADLQNVCIRPKPAAPAVAQGPFSGPVNCYDFRKSDAYRKLSEEDRTKLERVHQAFMTLWGALDRYADSHGGKPADTFDQLVPHYLGNLPNDPFATTETALQKNTSGYLTSKDGWGYRFRKGSPGNVAWCLSSVGLPDFPYLAASGNVGLYVCKGTWGAGGNYVVLKNQETPGKANTKATSTGESTKYLDAGKIDLGRFVYNSPSEQSPGKNPQEVAVLSEKQPALSDGQLLGFADGYVEYIGNSEVLNRLVPADKQSPLQSNGKQQEAE